MQPSAPSVATLPDLSDTRIAFAHKSDRALWKAYWLFKIIGTPTITQVGAGLTKAALAMHLPIRGAVKATIFEQFCGGETIDESLKTAQVLAKSGIGTILDHSVEGADDEGSLDHTVEEVLRTIAVAQGRKEVPFCVFKPTGIARVEILEKVSAKATLSPAEEAEWQRAQQRMEKICAAAAAAEVPTLVDAEESWIQDAIDHLTQRMMERYNTRRALIYNTVQLYRHDRLAFLKRSVEEAQAKGYYTGMKLVRGAYMEKERERAAEKGYPSPIQPDKAASDRDYDAALRWCVDHIDRVSIVAGTHNEESSLLLARLMSERGIAHNDPRICFSQLLGMSDNISYNLAKAGYRVAKYVPYGPVREVMPYLIRRANENTSARGQSGRELSLIMQERRRRKGR
jgi:proline dehydrogenase